MGLFSKLMKKEEKKEERTISIREEAGCVYSPVTGTVETMVIVTSGNGILERISAAAQVSAGDKLFKVE